MEKEENKYNASLLKNMENKRNTLVVNGKKVIDELKRLTNSLNIHTKSTLDMGIMNFCIVDLAIDIKEHNLLVKNIAILYLELSYDLPLDHSSKINRIKVIRELINNVAKSYMTVVEEYCRAREDLLYKALNSITKTKL